MKFQTIPHTTIHTIERSPTFTYIKGIHLTTEELKVAVRTWIKERPPAFFIDGMRQLVHCWEMRVAGNGDYMEK